MRRVTLLPVLVVGALSAFAPLATADEPSSSSSFDAVPEFEGLTQRWREMATAMHLPGYAVAVVKDGAILAIDTFGIRDIDDAPVTPDTMFYIASCTKTYTAFALAVLAADGHVDLDAPVRTYLPRFQLADEAMTATITVRDLLCHRPGINSQKIVFLDAYTGQITEDRYYHWLAEVTPGGTVDYTNVHLTLASRVIESVTGKRWQDALEELVFKPAGMHRTTAYASRMYGDANAAFPLEGAPGAYTRCAVRKTDEVMHAAGGMGTTAIDATRWLILHLQGGRLDGEQVFPAEVVKEMLTLQSSLPEPDGRIRRIDGFALAWFCGTYCGLEPYYMHGGGYIGSAAHLSFAPRSGIGVVVLANASPAGQAFCDIASIDVYDRLLDAPERPDLLPNYLKRLEAYRAEQTQEAPDGAPVTAADLSIAPEKYAATYTNEYLGDITVTLDGDHFTGNMGALSLTLQTRGVNLVTVVNSAGDTQNAEFVIGAAGAVEGLRVEFDEGQWTMFERR